MYTCRQCRSNRIKTRTNVSFGKTYTTLVSCKDCGSTGIDKVEDKFKKRRR